MFKCAFLGCGPRARGHARAYKTVQRGRIAAICDLDEKRLNDFGAEFGVATRYRDAHEMLEREKPDLLHIVTLPGLRVPTMTIAALGEAGPTKFAVNTQLHFHARNLELKRDVAEGRIGEVRFIDVSARSTPLDQGVHVLELAHSYNGFAPFASVFGQVGGPEDLASRQPAPAMAAASFRFANAVSAMERQTHDAGYESGTHNYGVEDDLAQARLTEACFDWLGNPATPHPCCLERSLTQFNAILGLYASALTHRPVELPFDPPDGLLDALRTRLA